MKWIDEHYDWENDKNFKKAYEHYNRKKIDIFLSDEDIERRLNHKF